MNKTNDTKLRMKIMSVAKHYNRKKLPYGVNWAGKSYLANDTLELVEKVLADLKVA